MPRLLVVGATLLPFGGLLPLLLLLLSFVGLVSPFVVFVLPLAATPTLPEFDKLVAGIPLFEVAEVTAVEFLLVYNAIILDNADEDRGLASINALADGMYIGISSHFDSMRRPSSRVNTPVLSSISSG